MFSSINGMKTFAWLLTFCWLVSLRAEQATRDVPMHDPVIIRQNGTLLLCYRAGNHGLVITRLGELDAGKTRSRRAACVGGQRGPDISRPHLGARYQFHAGEILPVLFGLSLRQKHLVYRGRNEHDARPGLD